MINDRYFDYHFSTLNYHLKKYSGGYSTRVPPLHIPNRVVKPCHADGTAFVGE